VLPDIPRRHSAQDSICNGMKESVGVGVPLQPLFKWNGHAAQN